MINKKILTNKIKTVYNVYSKLGSVESSSSWWHQSLLQRIFRGFSRAFSVRTMFRTLVLMVMGAQLGLIHTLNDTSEDQELLLVFAVSRHGERTPDEDEHSLSNEKQRLQQFIDVDGYEGLTNIGKARVYKLGKFIRKRYGSEGLGLLRKLYHHEDLLVRSTDKDRTKMSAQVAMAAVFPPETEQQWNDGLGRVWQPVPYVAVPLAEDYLRYYSNCNRFHILMEEAKRAAVHEELAPFSDLLELIQTKTGRDFRENPTMYQTLFDLFRSQAALGLEIPDWAEPIMPRLAEAARIAYRLHFRSDEMKRIGGGVVLNEFVQAARTIMAGGRVLQRFRLYSAHDFNVGALMEASNVASSERLVPEYGAMFALELYRSKSTGAYTVQPVYLAQAGSTAAEALQLRGCPRHSRCDFQVFLADSARFLLPEPEYYRLCGIRTQLGQ